MVNTTDTYWSINGVSLQTLAYNIETEGGDLAAPPPLRGEDQKIPYRVGEVFTDRLPDAMSRTFRMWVVGADEDGLVPRNPGARARFEKNLKDLRALFWNQGRQVSITKRWREYGSSVVREATGKAIFEDGFAPAMTGSARATFNVTMHFSDPFFYGAEETITFPGGQQVVNVTPTVLGDYPTTLIVADFLGTRNNIRLTNLTENHWANILFEVSSGQTLRMDVNEWTVNRLSPAANLVRYLSSQGGKEWFSLRPGAQQLRLSSASGTGGATLKYRPRWI